MKIAFYAWLGCLFIYCSGIFSADALIGENVRPVYTQEFNFVAALLNAESTPNTLFTHFCAGVLVSRRDVLTTNQCLVGKTLNGIRIALGSSDLNNSRHFYAKFWETYQNWASNLNIEVEIRTDNIAVIRMTELVGDNIVPVALSYLTYRDLIGRKVTTAGWGTSNNGENPLLMETVSMKVLSFREAERRSQQIDGVKITFPDKYLLAAATPYALLSSGDSGNPLFHKNKLVGIAHGTCLQPECTFHPEKLNIFYAVSFYQDFVYDVIHSYE